MNDELQALKPNPIVVVLLQILAMVLPMVSGTLKNLYTGAIKDWYKAAKGTASMWDDILVQAIAGLLGVALE